LCNYAGNSTRTPTDPCFKHPLEGSRETPIDLTFDSEDEAPTQKAVSPCKTQASNGVSEEGDLSYHSLSCDDASISDLLEMLSSKELEDLARQLKLLTTNKKVRDWALLFDRPLT
jgi:hypothetical protein